MGRIEIHRLDMRRLLRQVVQDVAAARCDGEDPAVPVELQCLQIDFGIFPDLRIDEALEGHREHPLEDAALRQLLVLDDCVGEEDVG